MKKYLVVTTQRRKHHVCLYLVSVHQMAPSQTEVTDI